MSVVAVVEGRVASDVGKGAESVLDGFGDDRSGTIAAENLGATGGISSKGIVLGGITAVGFGPFGPEWTLI